MIKCCQYGCFYCTKKPIGGSANCTLEDIEMSQQGYCGSFVDRLVAQKVLDNARRQKYGEAQKGEG